MSKYEPPIGGNTQRLFGFMTLNSGAKSAALTVTLSLTLI